MPLSPATANEIAEEHGLAATVPFKVYYPVKRVDDGRSALDETRFYKLNGHPAYVVVVAQGGLGQYYDLEGTTWQAPPILRSPDQTVRVAGRTMQLYFEGQRLRMIAWHDGPRCTGSSTRSRTCSATVRCWRSPARRSAPVRAGSRPRGG